MKRLIKRKNRKIMKIVKYFIWAEIFNKKQKPTGIAPHHPKVCGFIIEFTSKGQNDPKKDKRSLTKYI